MKPNKILDYEAEYYKMKKNNRGLAKALAEQQQLNKKYLDENVMLRKKLYVSSSMNMQYERSLNQILNSSKNSIDNCISLSNNLSNTMTLCKQGTNIQTTLLDNFVEDSDKNSLNKVTLRSTSPGNPHKTHAVKPLVSVSGHVIHSSPTINLPRITEIRVSGLRSVDNTVQNHNSPTFNTVNNHETINNNSDRSLSTNHLPIRGFTPETIEDTMIDDDSLEDDSIVIDDENNEDSLQVSNSRLAVSLEPLIEVSDEDSTSPYNNIVKEVRILIEPLHLDNNCYITGETNTPNIRQEKTRAKRLHQDDPLEGTSSMLDNSGNLIGYKNHRFKPRQSSKRMRVQYESDSEESVDNNPKKRFVTKRKTPAEKKDITGQKYKIKRTLTKDSISPLRSPDENNISNSFEDLDVPDARRSRRSAPKSLAEPSLKRKLRR